MRGGEELTDCRDPLTLRIHKGAGRLDGRTSGCKGKERKVEGGKVMSLKTHRKLQKKGEKKKHWLFLDCCEANGSYYGRNQNESKVRP